MEDTESHGELCPACYLSTGLSNTALIANEESPSNTSAEPAHEELTARDPLAAQTVVDEDTGALLASAATSAGSDPLSSSAAEETRIFHHYEVATRPDGSLWELGRGAMGITYKAVDVNLRRAVALKVINSDFLHRSLARERFVREARAAAQLRHPNIASVYHLGQRGDEHFYAMEFIDGETVDSFVHRRGRLDPALALDITAQVASALMAAQGSGLVHRDIKPSNLMLVRGGDCMDEASGFDASRLIALRARSPTRTGSASGLPCVKVIDFGVVKWTAGSPSDALHTAAADLTQGGTVGTPSFASPEQLTGGEEVDFRSDLYSLGCTLWFMLVGKPPFLGTPVTVISQHLGRKPPIEELEDLQLPPEVVGLLKTMLEKDPDDRHQSHVALLEDIDTCLGAVGGAPVSAGWRSEFSSSHRQRARRGERLLLLAVGAIACGALWLALRPAKKSETKLVVGADPSAGSSVSAVAPSVETAGKSVAVLPFENVSDTGASVSDYLGDAIAEDIAGQLARVGSELRVISRFSTMRFKGSTLPPAQIAKELGVGALLTGSVRKQPGSAEGRNDLALLRVHVELTEAATQRLLWSATYEQQRFAGLTDLQGEVARKIAEALHTKSVVPDSPSTERKATLSAAAYDLYLQGREAYYLYRKAGNEKAIERFQQAIALEPNFALAHAGLADALSQRVYRWNSPENELAKADEAARRAIALDPRSADGYKALGLIELIRGDLEGSLETNHRAIELNPNLVGAIGNIGAALRGLGRLDEALGWMKKAIVLDPINPNWHCSAADTAMFLLDDEFAEAEYQRALVVERNYVPAVLGLIHLHLLQGHAELARQECASFRARTPADNSQPLQLAALIEFYGGDFPQAEKLYTELLGMNRAGGARDFYGSVAFLSATGYLRVRAGDVSTGQALLSEAALADQEATRQHRLGGTLDAQLDLAAVWAALGQRDRAMAQLKGAMPGSLLGYRAFGKDPRFSSLANEPAFRDFLATAKSRLDAMRVASRAAGLK